MPNVAITLPELQTRRVALRNARAALITALVRVEDAKKAFKEAQRLFTPGDTEYTEAATLLSEAQDNLVDRRNEEAQSYGNLQSGLFSWLIDLTAENFVTVEDDIARLNQAYPIVMFPIRIETRFDGPKLRVRVFPDEIFLNRFEIALTDEEIAAGKKYFNDLNELDNEEERWREIIQRFGPERSAHILRAVQPTGFNTIPDPNAPCGGEQLKGGENRTLTFNPDLLRRAASWTRPGEATLPDRWVVVTYRFGVRKVTYGTPIVEPLAMTPDPAMTPAQQVQISSDPNYKIDEKLRWTVDFERAKEVGMGIEIDLDAQEAAIGTGGFDRVLVFGVKTSMEPLFTTFTLLELLDAHHHTRGLAFVRQGTPTNNTKDSPTPFPPDDDEGRLSFERERKRPFTASQFTNDCLPEDTDGAACAFSLGLPNGIFAQVDRAGEKEIQRATAMNRVIWPLTYGYFMKVLMDPIFSDENIAEAKDYATRFVRPRGVSPAFRVGEVPYGVLPVSSIYRWTSNNPSPGTSAFVTSKIVDPLRRLIPIWLDGSFRVPRVTGNATDPDVELMSILSTFPSTKEIRVRHAVGRVTWYNIFNFLGWSFTVVEQRMNALTEALFRRIGHPEWRPRIGGMVFDSRAWRLVFPLVAEKPLEEPVPATQAFITGIRNATLQQLKDNTFSGVPTSFSFLYSLLRHATLAEYARITDGFLAAAAKWKEPELFRFPSQPPAQSIVEAALAQIASAFAAAMAPHLEALDTLAEASDAELDRLLGESLDLASHRLDAWVTAVASQRLRSMRIEAEGFGQYLGGYAWVENLRPVQRSTKTIPNVGTFETQPGTGGYVHAPSMSHAAAAAILRSAHISHKREDPAKFAIDLSSRRVRNARKALDEVRAGQPLGAILGYRFERGLHEGHPGVDDLDKIRFAFRNLFPLVAGKNGSDTTELAENIAARNVVDGLVLIKADRENAIDYQNGPNLPRPGTNQFNAVKAEIAKLQELHDSIADLMTAESVYQLARGNVAGAPGPLTNLAVGRPPPDPSVAQSARTGIGVAHRVALVFSADHTSDLSPEWPAPTPRALGEPALDVWLGRIIGDPSAVTCTVTFNEAPGSATVALSDLGLRPLDILALARVAAEKGLGSVLDVRVLTAALGQDTTKTNIQIDYGRSSSFEPKTDRTFPEVLEVARALGVTLGGARPLEIGDLASPAEVEGVVADAETTASQDVEDIEGRASAALDALKEATNSTTVTADRSLARAIQVADPENPTATEIQNLRAALTVAAKFAPERAFPPRTASGVELLALAKAVQKELNRRIDAATKAQSASATLAKQRSDRALAVIKAVFGSDFVALPTLHVPRSEEIDESFDARSDLVGQDDTEVSRYLQQATRVRPNLRRFQKFSLYSRAFGAAPLSLNVAQLPRVPGEQWLGRKLESFEPKEGRAAVLFLSEEATPDAGVEWKGVLLEQWSEAIPNTKEQTAIAFHFDTPRAAAPQSVLVAVPSDQNVAWQFEDLVAILNETFDLAKMRAVDAELLPLGQTLPLAMVAQNDALDVTFATLYSAFVGAPSIDSFQGFT